MIGNLTGIQRLFGGEWVLSFATKADAGAVYEKLKELWAEIPGENQIAYIQRIDNVLFMHGGLTNSYVMEFASDLDRVRIVNIGDHIRSQEDYTDCINHFARNVYYEIAGAIAGYINELV